MDVKKYYIMMTEDQINSAAEGLAELIIEHKQKNKSNESEKETPGDESSQPI